MKGYDKIMEGQSWKASERLKFKLQPPKSKQVEKAEGENQNAYARALKM